MKCLRCGHCCIDYMVVIVKPEHVDNPDFENEDTFMCHGGDGTPCPHLSSWEGNKTACAVHHLPWYKKTPCFSHGQIESSPDCECRMGRYIIDNNLGGPYEQTSI